MRIWILALLLASSVYGQDPSAVYRDNVVMVVDASGSMSYDWTGTNDDKIDIAKNAMKTVLATIAEDTQIGIIVFGNVSEAWVYPLGTKNVEAITKAIDSIGTSGGTPLGTYIKRGADALIVQRAKQFGYGSYRLLIVTDGAASGYGEEDKMTSYTEEIIARGINVDVIGVDMGKKHALAQIVGENYRAADNPASLAKAITEVFGEIDQKQGDGGESDFELLEGLDPSLAKEMIGALAKPQNHPIGEQPKLKAKKVSSSSSPATTTWEVDTVQPDEGLPGIVWVGGGLLLAVIIGAAVKSIRL